MVSIPRQDRLLAIEGPIAEALPEATRGLDLGVLAKALQDKVRSQTALRRFLENLIEPSSLPIDGDFDPTPPP